MINPLNFDSALLYQLAEYRDHLVNTTPENEKYDIASDLAAVEDVISETKGCTEIIKESKFIEYIKNIIIHDYGVVTKKENASWPHCHVAVDYAAAAEEAKIDYKCINYNGETYLAR